MADETAEDLRVEQRGAVVLVTLNRPKALNALTGAMRTRFSEALWSAARNPDTYAVILQSASERAFSTGSDVREVIAWGRTDPAQSQGGVRRGIHAQLAVRMLLQAHHSAHQRHGDGRRRRHLAIRNASRRRRELCVCNARDDDRALSRHRCLLTCSAACRARPARTSGLRGARIGRADAYALGLVTHCIDSGEFDAITSEICRRLACRSRPR